MFPRVKNEYGEFELQYSHDCTFVLYKVMKDGSKMPIVDASCLFSKDNNWSQISIHKTYFYDETEEDNRDFEFILRKIKTH